MKLPKLLLNFLLLLCFFTFSQCKKAKTNPIDELPPETQTGANTFGCLVDGQAFKPAGASLSGGSLQCNYQYLGSGGGGGYYFRLVAINRNNSTGKQSSIAIFTDSLKISETESYTLSLKGIKNSANAQYLYSENQPVIFFDDYFTSLVSTGILKIKKIDSINQIVSGTFWFDALNANNEKVEIRAGRFDMRYTR